MPVYVLAFLDFFCNFLVLLRMLYIKLEGALVECGWVRASQLTL